jgi:hypothetical protein
LVHRCDDWGDVSTGLIHLELYGVMIEGRPRRPSIFFSIFVIPWICEIKRPSYNLANGQMHAPFDGFRYVIFIDCTTLFWNHIAPKNPK